jgi:hypothetical protein
MLDYEKVCGDCGSGISISQGSRDFTEYNEYIKEGFD